MEALNTTPKRNMVFESPHKVYVGNLAWSVRPEDLREYFSRFGNVVSARVLYDRKGGRNRVYGFLSFTSSDELRAALETSGSVVLLVFLGILVLTSLHKFWCKFQILHNYLLMLMSATNSSLLSFSFTAILILMDVP